MIYLVVLTLVINYLTPAFSNDHIIQKRYAWHDESNLQWAENCDWTGNDIGNVQGPSDQCGGQCASNSGCTHFTWTEFNGGTCWLKGGSVTQDQATGFSGGYSVCGIMKGGSTSASGTTTRYWDCCKGSCGWNGKAAVNSPVQSCQRDGVNGIDVNAQSGCNGGPSYPCNSNQPWAVNDNLAYGFAAAHLAGQSESDWCCACYQLQFTSGPVTGKTLVVQVVNTGGDLGDNHFDLQIPGGGVGIFNGCSSQWNAPPDGWGDRYGGVSSRDQCNQLPGELQPGCNWRFDWFQNADNPTMNLVRVRCPDELVQKSNCRRNDD